MQGKQICSYPPEYKGDPQAFAEALRVWLYQEISKILGKLNDIEQRLADHGI